MSARPHVVISDVHLGAIPEARERRFLEFLASWRGRAEQIFFNGDLFDFWFEYRSVIPAREFPVLRALADLRDSGVRLSLLGGNHDAWGGRFLRETLGIDLLEGPVRLELAGWRVWAAHGDGVGAGDLGYRALKRVLRHRWFVRAARGLVHPDWAEWLARRVSQTGDPSSRDRARSEARAGALAEFARARLRDDPTIDVVLLGHCHVPARIEVEPGRFYVNAGDWVAHESYAIFEPGRVEVRSADVP